MDSYRFLQDSLDKLVKSLNEEDIEINSPALKIVKEKYFNNIFSNKIEELKNQISIDEYENEPLKNLNLINKDIFNNLKELED